MDQERHIFYTGIDLSGQYKLSRVFGSFSREPAEEAWISKPGRIRTCSLVSPSQVRQFQPDSPRKQALPHDPFIIWLFEQVGLKAHNYQAVVLQRRLSACWRALRVSSSQAAQEALERHPQLIGKALDALLIGVSDFFRDPSVFECLRHEILPEMAQAQQGLRVYSAACSGGQELYSLAMLLHEQQLLERSYLLGIDCRAEAIQQARSGFYRDGELKGASQNLLQTYFERQEAGYRIVPWLRSRMHWRTGNMLTFKDLCPWDIILCRNVAIYLDSRSVDTLWARLAGQLRVGGILVTGKAERAPCCLPLKRLAPCLYRKTYE